MSNLGIIKGPGDMDVVLFERTLVQICLEMVWTIVLGKGPLKAKIAATSFSRFLPSCVWSRC